MWNSVDSWRSLYILSELLHEQDFCTPKSKSLDLRDVSTSHCTFYCFKSTKKQVIQWAPLDESSHWTTTMLQVLPKSQKIVVLRSNRERWQVVVSDIGSGRTIWAREWSNPMDDQIVYRLFASDSHILLVKYWHHREQHICGIYFYKALGREALKSTHLTSAYIRTELPALPADKGINQAWRAYSLTTNCIVARYGTSVAVWRASTPTEWDVFDIPNY